MYIPLHLKPYWWYKYAPLKEKNAILDLVKKCTKKSGGITNGNNKTEYLETVFYAIVLLGLIDSSKIIEEKTVNFILDKEKEDGGFADSCKHKPTLFNTFYAISSLCILDKITPQIRKNTIRYLEDKIIKKDGIYDTHHLQMSTTSIYWTLIIMKCLMYDVFGKRNYLVDYCMKCYDNKSKLFSPFPEAIPTIQNTFEAIVILKELSALALIDCEETYKAIIARKRQHLYFDDLLKRETFSSSMWAIGCLNLINKLDELENVEVLTHVKNVFRNPNTIFDVFCAANIFVNMQYKNGLVDINNTIVIGEKELTSSMVEIDKVTKKLKGSGMDLSLYDYTYLLKKTKYETSHKNEFLQIILNEKTNRYYEIEYSNQSVIGTQKAISRVNKETIIKRIMSKEKVKVCGVFDPKNNLNYSNEEYEVVEQYCKDNLFVRSDLFRGKDATSINLDSCLSNCYNVFYYSGHSDDGYLCFADTGYEIRDLFQKLINNNCHIAILNSCKTFGYVKNFFLETTATSDNFNVICSICDVQDEMGKWFLITFLYYLELGLPISEALRYTKKDLSVKTGKLGLSWWSYLLFGNPYTIIA